MSSVKVPSEPGRSVMDHPDGYGLVSRAFHWVMAALVVFQLITALLRFFADDTPVADFFFGFHFANGVLILLLALARGSWALVNIPRRPAHETTLHKFAAIGHAAIYALMIAVPVIALIRAYGSDRPFSVFGIPLFAGSDPEIDWMTSLGSLLHGELGWVLFALVAGHVTMAFVHAHAWKEPLITRMTRGHS